jgi:hypothetical protein
MTPARRLACALAVMIAVNGSAGEGHPAVPCRFTEQDMIGGWSSAPQDSDVVKDDAREFLFQREGEERVFGEYLHHRPMSSGTWRFDGANCTIALVYRHSGSETLRATGGRRPRLVGEGGEIYRKLKPAD